MPEFLQPYIMLLVVIVMIGVIPFWGAKLLCKQVRMPNHYWRFAWSLFALMAGLAVVGDSWRQDFKNVKLGIDLRGGTILIYEVKGAAGTADGVTQEQKAAVSQDFSMDELTSALKRRIDPTGVEEITVRGSGTRAVEIIVPNLDEDGVQSLKRKIRSVGSLEFRITANPGIPQHQRTIDTAMRTTERKVAVAGMKQEDGTQVEDVLGWWIPVAEKRNDQFDGRQYVTRTGKEEGRDVTEVLVLNDRFDVSGRYLKNATAGHSENATPCVHFSFNNVGAMLFGQLTYENLPDPTTQQSKQLGIILDGYIYSAPNIQSRITSSGQITGNFSQKEVEDLAGVLKSGRLPAVLGSVPSSEMTTGPTLGQDTIQRSTIAIGFSFVLVMGIMLFYYRFSGIIACIALLLDVIIIFAAMVAIKAAFTLPGLAGFVLTLGMAVDANILIFERMREEQDAGSGTLGNTIRNGFGRAMSAIVDSNITTLIVATILFYIGTEQIRGFAIMLWIGIVVSMFTAVYVSRGIFDLCERMGWLKELKMRRILPPVNIPFMKYARAAMTFSCILMVLGLVAVFARSIGLGHASKLLDIDFLGGQSVQLLFTEDQTEAGIYEKLSQNKDELPDLSVTNVSTRDEISRGDQNKRFSITATSPKGVEASVHLNTIQKILAEEFAGKLVTNKMDFKVVSTAPTVELPTLKLEGIPEVKPEETPAATETPVETEAPAAVEETPAVTEAPAAVEETPAETEAPAAVEETPVETEAPAAVEETPAETEAPAATETPVETEAPAATETPVETEAPAAVEETPAVTEAPAETVSLRLLDQVLLMAVLAQADTAKAPLTAEGLAGAARPTGVAELPTQLQLEAKRQTLVHLTFQQPLNAEDVRLLVSDQLQEMGAQQNNLGLARTEFDVTPTQGTDDSNRKFTEWSIDIDLHGEAAMALFSTIKTTIESTPLFPSCTTVGSQVAGNTSVQGLIALLASLVGIVIYLKLRFQRISYGLAAAISLVHNVIIVLGLIALSTWCGPFLRFLMIDDFKIGLTVLASFLTMIGYSLNDTIVVFDRIREIRGKDPKLTAAVVNRSINQTLARTIMTSTTTLIVVLILYIYAGASIHTFSFVLTAGIIVGTFSTIFIACPALFWLSGGTIAEMENCDDEIQA